MMSSTRARGGFFAKTVSGIATGVCLLLLTNGCTPVRTNVEPPTESRSHILVVAHRGAHQSCPENTVESIEQAIALGVDLIEVDIRMTGDGHFVCLHNGTVDARTNGQGRVRDLTLTELKALDAGSKFSPAFAGASIPTVDEVFARMRGRVGAYVDCKDAPPDSVVNLLARHGLVEVSLVYADPAELSAMIRLEPRISPLPEFPGDTSAWHVLAESILTNHVAISSLANLSPESVRACHARGAKVIVDIMAEDGPEGWQRALEMGVDGLQTDRPAELLAFLRARGLRRENVPPRVVEVIAHRGAHLNQPENTVPAIEEAITVGADWVEIDPAYTTDRELVILHDQKVNRTTDGTGRVTDLALAEVRALNVRNPDGSLAAGVRIPTLDEALAAMRGRVRIYLDAGGIDAQDLVEAVRRQEVSAQTAVYSDGGTLVELRALEPAVFRMLPRPPGDLGTLPEVMERVQPAIFGASLRDITPAKVAACHRAGARVFCNVLSKDAPDGWGQAIECGADALETDKPAELLAFLRARSLHP